MGAGALGMWKGNTGGTGDCILSQVCDGGTGGTYSIPEALRETVERCGITQNTIDFNIKNELAEMFPLVRYWT